MGKAMYKLLFAAVVAAGLIGVPLSPVSQTAMAQDSKAAKPKKEPSAAQLAERERIKKCGEEWKAAKAANKVEKGMTWPKYWSACNKRLKDKGA
jgi:hypothetical protein